MHDQLVYEETHNLREIGFLPGLSDLLAYPSSWMIINVRQKVFWDSIGNFDAVPYWQRLSIESLVLYGELDTNVPSSESAEILRSLGKPNIDVRIYKGSGMHLNHPQEKETASFGRTPSGTSEISYFLRLPPVDSDHIGNRLFLLRGRITIRWSRRPAPTIQA